jgi:hypothetical protein
MGMAYAANCSNCHGAGFIYYWEGGKDFCDCMYGRWRKYEMKSKKLKQAIEWESEPLYKRLDMCCLALSIHGCITHAERERIRDKIQKHLSNGRYHELGDSA